MNICWQEVSELVLVNDLPPVYILELMHFFSGFTN